MTDRELLQMALDAWEESKKHITDQRRDKTMEALRAALAQPNDFSPDWDAMSAMVEEQQRMAKRIEELEAALAQPEQEPVAWWHDMGDVVDLNVSGHGKPLYFAIPQREWVGLTHEEIGAMEKEYLFGGKEFDDEIGYWAVYRAIEAKLKEKNT